MHFKTNTRHHLSGISNQHTDQYNNAEEWQAEQNEILHSSNGFLKNHDKKNAKQDQRQGSLSTARTQKRLVSTSPTAKTQYEQPALGPKSTNNSENEDDFIQGSEAPQRTQTDPNFSPFGQPFHSLLGCVQQCTWSSSGLRQQHNHRKHNTLNQRTETKSHKYQRNIRSTLNNKFNYTLSKIKQYHALKRHPVFGQYYNQSKSKTSTSNKPSADKTNSTHTQQPQRQQSQPNSEIHPISRQPSRRSVKIAQHERLSVEPSLPTSSARQDATQHNSGHVRIIPQQKPPSVHKSVFRTTGDSTGCSLGALVPPRSHTLRQPTLPVDSSAPQQVYQRSNNTTPPHSPNMASETLDGSSSNALTMHTGIPSAPPSVLTSLRVIPRISTTTPQLESRNIPPSTTTSSTLSILEVAQLAWADTTNQQRIRNWRRFTHFMHKQNMKTHPPTAEQIYKFVTQRSKSPSTQLMIINNVVQSCKLFCIDIKNRELLYLATKGLRRLTQAQAATPISYNQKHCKLIELETAKRINQNAYVTKVWLMLYLCFERYMRPSDVARIEKSTIVVNRNRTLFKCKLTKEMKQRKTTQAHTNNIVSTDPILSKLMQRHLDFTRSHTNLFQHQGSRLSSQRISSLVKPLLRALNLPYQVRHLRPLGSTHSFYCGKESAAEICQQARWKQMSMFTGRYMKSKHK